MTTDSAPVVDSSNRAVIATSAVGFTAQLNKTALRQLGEELHERASEVSRALSGRTRSNGTIGTSLAQTRPKPA